MLKCTWLLKFPKAGLSARQLLACVLLCLATASTGYGQEGESERKISGKITDEFGNGLPGVNILVSGTTIGTQTDASGQYTLIVPPGKDVLHVSFVGYTAKDITIGTRTTIDIEMEPDIQALKEVVVVGYGSTQRKENLVTAVTSVDPARLKTASSNLTNSLAGRVAGIISYQQSGEPGLGTDNSQFYIRGLSSFGSGKKDPLILIDNVESTPTDMARLQTDDIESFSVLKDAAAAAVYGTRGANGVILITTKLGAQGATRYTFRVENVISTNTRNFKMADNISYMRDANEAVLTRYSDRPVPYTENKINHTIAGDDPYLYPNNDWMDQLIKDYTVNQRYNLSVSGGSEKVRYYLAGTYNVDNGVLKVEPINDFNSNIKLRNYSVRNNITLALTKSTEFVLRLYAQFDDYNGPVGGGSRIFQHARTTNPVLFPAIYPSSKLPYINHPLFGSYPAQSGNTLSTGLLVNPYAEMVRGYQVYKTSNVNPQVELSQDLGSIVPGLTVKAMAYLQRYSYFSVARYYTPFYYQANVDPVDPTQYTISVLNAGGTGSFLPTGHEYLIYDDDIDGEVNLLNGDGNPDKRITSKMYLQGTLNYERIFSEKHEVTGLLTSFVSSFEEGNAGSATSSLPVRNTVLAGRFTYGYDSRYLMEFNFGYNGSERFSKKNRYGFFPSIGVAYHISNEAFFQPFTKTITDLKLRATYGVAGNDQIGNLNDRFFYLSNVNPDHGNFGASFGRGIGTGLYSRPGYRTERYGDDNVQWELSKQINIGIDLTLLNSVTLVANVFKTYRSNMYLGNDNIESAQGLIQQPSGNYGKGETQGIDLNVDYTRTFSSDFSLTVAGTFTYATSKIVKNTNIEFPDNLAHLRRQGYSFDQAWGYIAERLFIDDEEVQNSPVQQVSSQALEVRGGDIKYRDINNDGVINSDDMVPIGYPTRPEIIYGIGPSLTYKRFDFGFMFQGAARTSFFIDPVKIQPFLQFGGYNNRGDLVSGNGYQNGELQAIHESHWSEENRDLYAFWPRLSQDVVWNNAPTSTWWMRNGSFLRLKTVTLGYTFTATNTPFPIRPRVYFSANNVFAISKFKLWDVEMGGNGLGYPVQAVYMMGVQLNLN